MKDPRIETYTGLRVNPLDLKPEDICIEDIAHHLSLICRFTGACRFHYSVGQHSLLVAEVLNNESYFTYTTPKIKRLTMLEGLLHDGAEAYFNDLARPVKANMKGYRDMEDRALGAIMKKFNAQGGEYEYVMKADDLMIYQEARALMASRGDWWADVGWPTNKLADLPSIELRTPKFIEVSFLEVFKLLSEGPGV